MKITRYIDGTQIECFHEYDFIKDDPNHFIVQGVDSYGDVDYIALGSVNDKAKQIARVKIEDNEYPLIVVIDSESSSQRGKIIGFNAYLNSGSFKRGDGAALIGNMFL
eukprot:CAMPEP_0168520454 /NCGR_PEP_ID=MMETSP0405-20121227/8006_1 /TAXON_ID=498012 /ORGANISM="Trichosphaerium sp, Strain Am-I-7 wt" /LENGTH=107 /DNA_ID=CAMNT_0008541357 /DNA_START=552 /DNA_END=872 /DNA_ORIENTATION=-